MVIAVECITAERLTELLFRCVLELHAIANKKAESGGEFAVAMTASERNRFLIGMKGLSKDDTPILKSNTLGSSSYLRMLASVDAEKSQCSRPEDLESIFEGIRSSVGFEKMNRMLFGVMEEWMVGQLRAELAASRDKGDESDAISLNEGLSRLLSELGRDNEALELDKEALIYYKSKGIPFTFAGKGFAGTMIMPD
jgi:hypothetical protein